MHFAPGGSGLSGSRISPMASNSSEVIPHLTRKLLTRPLLLSATQGLSSGTLSRARARSSAIATTHHSSKLRLATAEWKAKPLAAWLSATSACGG